MDLSLQVDPWELTPKREAVRLDTGCKSGYRPSIRPPYMSSHLKERPCRPRSSLARDLVLKGPAVPHHALVLGTVTVWERGCEHLVAFVRTLHDMLLSKAAKHCHRCMYTWTVMYTNMPKR